MQSDERVDRLIDLVYEAALEPAVWSDFVEALSEAFGGAAARLGISLPPDGRLARSYWVGLDPAYAESFPEHLVTGLPWKAKYAAGYTDRFASLGDAFPDVDFAQSDLYTSWFKPQDLAPEWPIGHSILIEGDLMVGQLTIYRRGDGPFDPVDLGRADRLVRHLTRAFIIHTTLGGVRRERLALAEVMDRLPTGVILIDSRRQPVVTNQSADKIFALDDGLRIDASGPAAADARENAMLQKLVADVLDASPGRELESSGFLAVSRPSGKRSFPVMVTPLLAAPPGSRVRDAAAAIFVSNPEEGLVSATEVLETIYALTHSEAELVRLLSQGQSLEEAAETRGVSINTARSHLKRVFAKTDTRRQGELVRLVLTGVASLRDD